MAETAFKSEHEHAPIQAIPTISLLSSSSDTPEMAAASSDCASLTLSTLPQRKTALLNIALELRQKIYKFVLPHLQAKTTGDRKPYKALIFNEVGEALSLLFTCKQVSEELPSCIPGLALICTGFELTSRKWNHPIPAVFVDKIKQITCTGIGSYYDPWSATKEMSNNCVHNLAALRNVLYLELVHCPMFEHVVILGESWPLRPKLLKYQDWLTNDQSTTMTYQGTTLWKDFGLSRDLFGAAGLYAQLPNYRSSTITARHIVSYFNPKLHLIGLLEFSVEGTVITISKIPIPAQYVNTDHEYNNLKELDRLLYSYAVDEKVLMIDGSSYWDDVCIEEAGKDS